MRDEERSSSGVEERFGQQYCDGMSRRNWLQIGGLAMGGLSLPAILRAESTSQLSDNEPGNRRRAKGIIMVLLPGGPSHMDMYDLKPEAPSEVRGEFHPIETRVPGIDRSEERRVGKECRSRWSPDR